MQERAEQLLCQMLGPEASFREGQLQAIVAVAEQRQRVLVVQRTGWGKSLVYFIATKLLREDDAGPTLLVSPLLSLMRNQITMAERIGVRAATINSANTAEWNAVETAIAADRCDALLISPERLNSERFLQQTLPRMQGRVGLFVVDEAHCISDWGHDFRPDYRRIVRLIRALPRGVPVLGTTATANDRVVRDIAEQLGTDLHIMRGPLARATLRLQTIRLADQSERLAWLLEHLPTFPGSGIIYCLTIADTRRVAEWLRRHGVDTHEYHADLDGELRALLEQRLVHNEVKALVATVALGMGFDKPDLGFVVHYQRPGSVVAYYQQVGRAGRAVEDAIAILLNGREDDEIQGYFIESAFPSPIDMQTILGLLEQSASGLTINDLLRQTNLSPKTVHHALKLLEIEGAVSKQGISYARTLNPWLADAEHMARVTAQRQRELEEIREYVEHAGCLMKFISRALDDPSAEPCGRCANCAGDFVARTVRPELVREAIAFLCRDFQTIEPRKQWPEVLPDAKSRTILPEHRLESGRALCIYGDAGWGRAVRIGKYRDLRFVDELVREAATLIHDRWRPEPRPTWVTAIPSWRHPALVPDFARRLAAALGLPYHQALANMQETPEQKTMQNSVQQFRNVFAALRAAGHLPSGPVLLVDDIVDSRWTLTVAGYLLRRADVSAVFPFTLAVAAGGAGDVT